MSRKSAPPAFHATRFNCPKCGTYAAHDWWELYVQVDNGYDSGLARVADKSLESTDQQDTTDLEWEVSQCSGCEDHSLWIDGTLVYPVHRAFETPDPVDDMPTDVRELYLEAAAVLPHSRRAAAALCRASLERLTKHLTQGEVPKNTNLDGRLLRLADRTTGSLTKALQVIRHVGNTALHGARDDDESVVIYMDGSEDQLVNMLFVTINELVYELISRPKHIDDTYSMLPETVRQSFENRSKSST